MELKEFLEKFDLETRVKIIEKEELIFEGKVATLDKILRAKIITHGCKKPGNEPIITMEVY